MWQGAKGIGSRAIESMISDISCQDSCHLDHDCLTVTRVLAIPIDDFTSFDSSTEDTLLKVPYHSSYGNIAQTSATDTRPDDCKSQACESQTKILRPVPNAVETCVHLFGSNGRSVKRRGKYGLGPIMGFRLRSLIPLGVDCVASNEPTLRKI